MQSINGVMLENFFKCFFEEYDHTCNHTFQWKIKTTDYLKNLLANTENNIDAYNKMSSFVLCIEEYNGQKTLFM